MPADLSPVAMVERMFASGDARVVPEWDPEVVFYGITHTGEIRELVGLTAMGELYAATAAIMDETRDELVAAYAAEPDTVAIGDKVAIVLGPVRSDEAGRQVLSYKFERI